MTITSDQTPLGTVTIDQDETPLGAPSTLVDLLYELGLYTATELAALEDGTFLRADSVLAMVKALMSPISGSEGTLLINVLAGMELFDQGRANAFMMTATELLIRYNII